jgi:hypothetical protein
MSLISRVIEGFEVLLPAGDAGGSGGSAGSGGSGGSAGGDPPPEAPGGQEGETPSPAEAVPVERLGRAGTFVTTRPAFGGLAGILGRGGAATTGGVAGGVPVSSAGQGTVFVELGAAAEQAAITRDGVQVPLVQFNPAALGPIVGGLRRVPARVISQSIQPGVSVAKGTTVDITLSEPELLPVSVLQDAFTPLGNRTMADVYQNIIAGNPALQSVLTRNASGTGLSVADTATLTTALTQANAPPGTGAGASVETAFGTLQAAFTFSSGG